MEFSELTKKALTVREVYRTLEQKKYGREWTSEEVALGFVGDVGDLMKLVIAKNGARDIEDADEKLRHELSDCLWSVLVLADMLKVDLEPEFMKAMEVLEARVVEKVAAK